MKTEYKKILKHFPQLKEWRVSFGNIKNIPKSYDCVVISPNKKNARIYPASKPIPDDYILHETLHIILRDLKKERNKKEYRNKEENLIRFICKNFNLKQWEKQKSVN